MRVAEAILTVARAWMVKADHDLMAAAQILKLGKAAPTDAQSSMDMNVPGS